MNCIHYLLLEVFAVPMIRLGEINLATSRTKAVVSVTGHNLRMDAWHVRAVKVPVMQPKVA